MIQNVLLLQFITLVGKNNNKYKYVKINILLKIIHFIMHNHTLKKIILFNIKRVCVDPVWGQWWWTITQQEYFTSQRERVSGGQFH